MKEPKQIIIETSRTCNLRCVGCPINSDAKQKKKGKMFMDMDLFTSIIDRVDFPTTIIPWMNGEPLMHPKYYQMVKYITDRGHRMYITTNGHFWNDKLFHHITDKNSCYQIIFSLDGMYPASITGARPGSDIKKVTKNILRFRDLKQDKNPNNIDLGVKIVLRGQDWEEIEEYIGYWLSQGVDFVCLGRMLDQETATPMRKYPCQYPDDNFMVIRHDGSLVLCAYNEEMVNNPNRSVGSVVGETPLLDLYNNEAYTKFREDQDNGVFTGPCVNCGFAYTGYGYSGIVGFRNPDLDLPKVYFHRDYYNSFFSLRRKEKPDSYYFRREGY